MISNPNLVLYACVARGSLILAEFFAKEPGIETLAAKCVENTPPRHSMFSHTVRKRNYTFLIEDDFAYFGIFDEAIDKSESIWLLNRLKCATNHVMKHGFIKKPSHLCLQPKFDPDFTEILMLDVDLDLVGSRNSMEEDSRDPSLDSSERTRTSVGPLLGKHISIWKKSKKKSSYDSHEDHERSLCVDENNGTFSKDLRTGIFHGVDHLHRQKKAKQMWRKHLWIVLTFDLLICAVLFGIWLWVCQGFQCIDG